MCGNLHAYVANEMHQGWGFEIPKGIDNAVGYSDVLGRTGRSAAMRQRVVARYTKAK